MAMPHRWDDLCREPIFVTKPVNPGIQVKEFAFDVVRRQGAPIDWARHRGTAARVAERSFTYASLASCLVFASISGGS